MAKNNETINIIKETLRNFEKEYIKNDLKNIDNFVNDFFVNEDDTSFIGKGLNDWHFGVENIKSAFKIYWDDSNKLLKNIELDIDKSIISVEGDIASVAINGKSTFINTENDVSKNMVNCMAETLDKGASRRDLLKLSDEISRTLYNISLGETYICPFRATIVMINNKNIWKIKHMNISCALDGREIVLDDENLDDNLKILEIRQKDNEDIKEIKKILDIFQDGYDKRDEKLVDIYGEKLLWNDENLFIFGTDQGEDFYGFNEGKELFESDWKYWGDFNLNRENAYIYVYENVAVVLSKAFITFNFKEDKVCTWPKQNFDYYKKQDKSKIELLQDMLFSINNALNCMQDEKQMLPMKFIGVLVKKEGRWKFSHMHFSDIIEDGQEVRKSE